MGKDHKKDANPHQVADMMADVAPSVLKGAAIGIAAGLSTRWAVRRSKRFIEDIKERAERFERHLAERLKAEDAANHNLNGFQFPIDTGNSYLDAIVARHFRSHTDKQVLDLTDGMQVFGVSLAIARHATIDKLFLRKLTRGNGQASWMWWNRSQYYYDLVGENKLYSGPMLAVNKTEKLESPK